MKCRSYPGGNCPVSHSLGRVVQGEIAQVVTVQLGGRGGGERGRGKLSGHRLYTSINNFSLIGCM